MEVKRSKRIYLSRSHSYHASIGGYQILPLHFRARNRTSSAAYVSICDLYARFKLKLLSCDSMTVDLQAQAKAEEET